MASDEQVTLPDRLLFIVSRNTALVMTARCTTEFIFSSALFKTAFLSLFLLCQFYSLSDGGPADAIPRNDYWLPNNDLVLTNFNLTIPRSQNTIPRNDYWLPDNLVPTTYNLSLLVNMERRTTEGKVRIKLEVKKATDQITLHVHHRLLTVLEEQVEVFTSVEKIPIKEQKYDEERMFYIMKLSKHLPEGTKLDLVMLFTGRIQNGEETDAIGFYTSPDDAGGLVTEFVYCLNYQKDTLPVGLTMP